MVREGGAAALIALLKAGPNHPLTPHAARALQALACRHPEAQVGYPLSKLSSEAVHGCTCMHTLSVQGGIAISCSEGGRWCCRAAMFPSSGPGQFQAAACDSAAFPMQHFSLIRDVFAASLVALVTAKE